MEDMIRRSDALKSIEKVVVSPRGGYLTKAKITAAIQNDFITPTVEAVPLHALCKYLAALKQGIANSAGLKSESVEMLA